MTGDTSGKMTWNSSRFGSATRPSDPKRGRKIASRCFQAACSVPYIQRKRCFSSAAVVSGASVHATARSSYATCQPERRMVSVRSVSSASVSCENPPASMTS